jgi:hypothetical protein
LRLERLPRLATPAGNIPAGNHQHFGPTGRSPRPRRMLRWGAIRGPFMPNHQTSVRGF